MAETFVFSFVRPDLGTEFVYGEAYGFAATEAEEVQHDVPTGETPGRDGEYQGDSRESGRTWAVRGEVVGSKPSEVVARLNTLMGAHPRGAEGHFRAKVVDDVAGVVTDRRLPCRVSYRRKAEHEDDGDWRGFAIGFRSRSPHWEDWDLSAAVPLTVGVATAVTPGGTEYARPVLTVVVSAPGTVTVTPSTVGAGDDEQLVIEASAAGTYVIDCDAGTVLRGAANALGEVASGGCNLSIPPTASTLTVAGATVASASAQYRRRWFAAV